MSYRKGFNAFILRFKKRFPESLFHWEQENNEGYGDTNYNFKVSYGDQEILSIYARLGFGLGLDVSSKFLNPKRDPEQQKYDMGCRDGMHSFSLYRRPLRVCFANQHNMRLWLQNKPKFARLGASLSKQILSNFLASQKMMEPGECGHDPECLCPEPRTS
jgi:hypothetical protein